MNTGPDTTPDARPSRLSALRTAVTQYMHLRVDDRLAGLGLLKDYALAGWQYRLGLGVLLLGVLATACLTIAPGRLPTVSILVLDDQVLSLPALGLWVALLVLALGWTFLLHGAMAYGTGPFVLVAVYVMYFGLYPAMTQAQRPWFALVPLWLGLEGGALAARTHGPWRHAWLLILALVVGICSYAPFGLNRLFPGLGLAGRLGLGLIYFILLAGPLRKLRLASSPLMLAVTFVLFALLYVLALSAGPLEAVLSMTFDSLHTFLGLVSLYWFWMGLGLFTGAHDLMAWIVGASRRLLVGRLLRVLIVLFWLLRLLVGYLATRVPPLWFLQALGAVPGGIALLQRFWALPWSFEVLTALHYDLYVMLAVLGIALALWLARKLTHTRLVALLGYSLLALLVLLGGVETLVMAAAEREALSSLWPLLLFVAGTLWEIVQSASALVTGSETRRPLFLGFLLLVVAIALIELGSSSPLFRLELTLNTLLGALYLGLPYLLYRYAYQRQEQPPLSGRGLLLLFAAGMASALPALWLEAWYLAPLLWCLALLILAWRAGRWTRWSDGLTYGLALGLGYVTYHTQPVMIPVPGFLPQLSALAYAQTVFAENILYPWQPQWWLVLLVYSLAASLLGLFAWRAHRAVGWRAWVWLSLGCLLSLAFLSLVLARGALA